MGLFDRLRGSSSASEDDEAGAVPLNGPERIVVQALSAQDEERLARARALFPKLGVSASDLGTITSAYEGALATGDDTVGDSCTIIDVVATAIGDHCVERGGYRWVVITDSYGTDLAIAPPRGEPTVVGTVVAARWLNREAGWITELTRGLLRRGGAQSAR